MQIRKWIGIFYLLGWVQFANATEPIVHVINPSINVDIGEQAVNTFIIDNFQPEFSYNGAPLSGVPQTCADNLGEFEPFTNAVEIGTGTQRVGLKLHNITFDFEKDIVTLFLGMEVLYGYVAATSTYTYREIISYSRPLNVDAFTYDIGTKKIKVYLNKTGIVDLSDKFIDVKERVVGLTLVYGDIKIAGNAAEVDVKEGDKIKYDGKAMDFNNTIVSSITQFKDYFIASVILTGGKCPPTFDCPIWNGNPGPDNGPGLLLKTAQQGNDWTTFLDREYGSLPDYVRTELKNRFSEIEVYSKDLLERVVDGIPVKSFFNLSKDITDFIEYNSVKINGLVQAQLETFRNYVSSEVYKHGSPTQKLDPNAIATIDRLFATTEDFTSDNFATFLAYYREHTSEFINMEDDVKLLLDTLPEKVVAYTQEQIDTFKNWIESGGYNQLPKRITTRIRNIFTDANAFTTKNIVDFHAWLFTQRFPRLLENAAVFWDDRLTTISFSFEDDFMRLSITPHLEVEQPYFRIDAKRIDQGYTYVYQLRISSNAKYKFKQLGLYELNGPPLVPPSDGELVGDISLYQGQFYSKTLSFASKSSAPTYVLHGKFYNTNQFIYISHASNLIGTNDEWRESRLKVNMKY